MRQIGRSVAWTFQRRGKNFVSSISTTIIVSRESEQRPEVNRYLRNRGTFRAPASRDRLLTPRQILLPRSVPWFDYVVTRFQIAIGRSILQAQPTLSVISIISITPRSQTRDLRLVYVRAPLFSFQFSSRLSFLSPTGDFIWPDPRFIRRGITTKIFV